MPAYPTLSTLGAASSTDLTNHTGNTTAHITASERTNWNKAYTNNHTHSNKSVIDVITSTKVTNWDKVVTDWSKIFEIDSNGNLRVKVNLYGDKEISAYGSGTSGGSTEINLENYYTKDEIDDKLDNIDVGDIDLSEYSKTSHTHSNYALSNHTHTNYSVTSHTHAQYASSSHTHPISAITNLQSSLDGKSGTGHSHSNYSLTSHTHSAYAGTGHSHSNYATTTNFNSHSGNTTLHITAAERTAWNAKSDAHSHPYASSSHTHSNYSVTSHTHALSALTSTAHTHSVIVGSYTSNGGQQAPNYFGKNRVGALMMNTTVNGNSDYKDWLFMDCYSGNDVGGGVAFGVNRQNLGAYIMRSASGRTSWAASAELIGTHNYTKYCATSGHTHNYAGSSSAGGAATSANKVNSTLTFTGGTFAAKTFNGSAATTVNIPTHTSHITNNSGFITTAATVANANYATSAGSATNATTASKLSTVSKTAWGQTFWTSGGIPTSISGNMTGVGSISASGNITTSAEVTAHSDKRLKDNIQPLTNRGYITPTTYIKDGKESIGFIAQDMQKLYPELVTVDESTEEKYLTVNYMQYTAVLQAQIIELSKEIQELKDKLNDIYNKE